MLGAVKAICDGVSRIPITMCAIWNGSIKSPTLWKKKWWDQTLRLPPNHDRFSQYHIIFLELESWVVCDWFGWVWLEPNQILKLWRGFQKTNQTFGFQFGAGQPIKLWGFDLAPANQSNFGVSIWRQPTNQTFGVPCGTSQPIKLWGFHVDPFGFYNTPRIKLPNEIWPPLAKCFNLKFSQVKRILGKIESHKISCYYQETPWQKDLRVFGS